MHSFFLCIFIFRAGHLSPKKSKKQVRCKWCDLKIQNKRFTPTTFLGKLIFLVWKNAQKFLCKIIFHKLFFLHFFQKNRSDVNGVIIFSNKFALHQPFFQFVQNYRIFMVPYIKENGNKNVAKSRTEF